MVHKTRLVVSFFILVSVSLLLIAVFLFLVKTDHPTNVPEEQIALPGQPITVENFRYTVTNVHENNSVTQGVSIFASQTVAREGAKFVIFDVSIENMGKEKGYVNKGVMFVTDSEDRKFDVAGGRDKVLRELPAIDPGLTAEYVEFYVEVPENVLGLMLHIKGTGFLSSAEGKFYLENTKTIKNASSDK
jgi:hypothetical protein